MRAGGIGQTTMNFTGQRLDGSGLLYYHARYYDPALARFISADSVVPGSANGSMDGVALKPLTVDFHEPGFATTLAGENAQPFWFQMNDDQRQQAGYAGGALNPQALNRTDAGCIAGGLSGFVTARLTPACVQYKSSLCPNVRSSST